MNRALVLLALASVLAAACCCSAAELPLTVEPAEVNFVAAGGRKEVPQQTLSLWLSDRARRWKIETDADWLTISPREGDGSAARMTAHFGVRHAGLGPGVYRTKAIVMLAGAAEARVEVPVTLRVFDLDEVWDVGGRKQLFIDRRFIKASENVALRVNPPQKAGQTLDDKGNPWHAGHILRVLDETSGKARMYFGVEHGYLAESADGIHWTKDPRVDIPIDFATVLVDPRDVPERRYKVFSCLQFEGRPTAQFDPATGGIYAYVSADGMHFTKAGRVMPMWIDNPLIPCWDQRIGKYVVFGRAQAAPESEEERRGGVENQRRVMRIETDDLLAPWPYDRRYEPGYHRYLLSNKHVPVVLQNDEKDYPWSDIYYNSATIYPYAQDVYLMFTAEFSHFKAGYHNQVKPRPGGPAWEDFGLIEIQLAVSRDGIHWDRPERVPYVAMGRPDQWDRWLLTSSPGLVRKGNDLLQYYTSTGHTHDANILRPEEYAKAAAQVGGTGILRQRLDGFVSADTGPEGGSLTTPPLVFRGKRLRLNIDTGSMGLARVEIRDARGRPIPGFDLASCEEITGNFVDYYVQWKSGNDVSSLAGRPVILHFQMKRAKLYGFQFTEE